MKLKYSIILIILITTTLEIWAQNSTTNYSGLFKSDTDFNLLSDNFQKIAMRKPNVYAGITHSISLDFAFENNKYDDVYFDGNMPTLNQFKNSMMEKIKVSAKSETQMNFDYTKDDEQDEKKESDSFFSSNLFYFLGAAFLATTFYFIWQDNQNESSTKSFGYPPRPQTDP